jgi:hypothetical protein
MYTNANVRSVNGGVWSARSTGATRALTEGNGASETAYRRPHAPRSAKPKDAALTDPHLDISSTCEVRSAAHGSRILDCARPILRLLASIQARRRLRIGYSPPTKSARFAAQVVGLDTPGIRVSISRPVDCRPRHAQGCILSRAEFRPTAVTKVRRNERDPRSNFASNSSCPSYNSGTRVLECASSAPSCTARKPH